MNYYGKDWRGSKWISFDWDTTYSWRVPKHPACYAVYMDHALVYVGQTNDLRARLSGHRLRHGYANNFHTPWGQCKTLLVKARFADRAGDWAMREFRLIKRLQPPENAQHGPKKVRRPSAPEIHPKMWRAA